MGILNDMMPCQVAGVVNTGPFAAIPAWKNR